MIALRDLTIFRASAPQARVASGNSYDQWGKPRGVSYETYLEIDERLERNEHTDGGRHIVWCCDCTRQVYAGN